MNSNHTFNYSSLIQGLANGEKGALSRAISLVESQRPDHIRIGEELVGRIFSADIASKRIAISGSPGVGKSSFIEKLGALLAQEGKRIAVLAVDPSSEQGGSILGDKTRMSSLSKYANVFIRPSSNNLHQGGVNSCTRESIALCEAAGYEYIFVETVGIGQSESEVTEMVDCVVLLVNPYAGDGLQSIKRGLREKADIVIVHKSDPENMVAAKAAKADIEQALHLGVTSANHSKSVLLASSLTSLGISEVRSTINSFFNTDHSSKSILNRRKEQNNLWLKAILQRKLDRLKVNWMAESIEYDRILNDLQNDSISVHQAAKRSLESFLKEANKKVL